MKIECTKCGRTVEEYEADLYDGNWLCNECENDVLAEDDDDDDM
jgi:formylmethanofuran dehydrogenase subunit E